MFLYWFFQNKKFLTSLSFWLKIWLKILEFQDWEFPRMWKEIFVWFISAVFKYFGARILFYFRVYLMETKRNHLVFQINKNEINQKYGNHIQYLLWVTKLPWEMRLPCLAENFNSGWYFWQRFTQFTLHNKSRCVFGHYIGKCWKC